LTEEFERKTKKKNFFPPFFQKKNMAKFFIEFRFFGLLFFLKSVLLKPRHPKRLELSEDIVGKSFNMF